MEHVVSVLTCLPHRDDVHLTEQSEYTHSSVLCKSHKFVNAIVNNHLILPAQFTNTTGREVKLDYPMLYRRDNT